MIPLRVPDHTTEFFSSLQSPTKLKKKTKSIYIFIFVGLSLVRLTYFSGFNKNLLLLIQQQGPNTSK